MLQVEPQAFSSRILVFPFYLHKQDLRTPGKPLHDFLVDNSYYRTFLAHQDVSCPLASRYIITINTNKSDQDSPGIRQSFGSGDVLFHSVST